MSATLDLFASTQHESNHSQSVQRIALSDASIAYTPILFNRKASDRYFQDLLDHVQWRQERITLYGKTHNIPRLSAWYGDPEKNYTYSGLYADARAWIEPLLQIKEKVELHCGARFNAVLVNLYRDGKDSVAWHSDDEPELGKNPEIASISFGAIRTFQMRSSSNHAEKYSLKLEHGSCFFMSGKTQSKWQHQIPKEHSVMNSRINLTFRMIK